MYSRPDALKFVWLWLASGALLLAAEFRVSIQDSSGRPTAAAVRLYNDRGELQIPADALDLARMGHLYAPGALIHYADWTSPRVRSQDPFFGSSFFRAQHPRETACFFTKGGFRLSLSPGRYQLIVSKGFEYTPVERTISVGESRVDETITVARWVDMPARGWYSGDGHVHIARGTGAANQGALQWAAAEDVQVSNVLLMGDARQTYYPQYAFGQAGRAEREGRWLVPGQEEPRTGYLGHTLHLNTGGELRDAAKYYSYRPIFERSHDRGLAGFAHVGRRRWSFHVDRGLSLLVPAGLVDFVEIAQMGYIGVNLWYDFLNLGFRLTAMAGSDVPWGGTIGSARVYAYTGDGFDVDRWFAAVRAGHTFVTTGPMLDFSVNGERPGSVIRAKRGDVIRVKARVWGETPGARPVRLQLISFGRVMREISGDGALETTLEFRAEKSLWITAAGETNAKPLMDVPGFFSGAVATPVFVEVDGQPCRDLEHLKELVARRLRSLDEIERWLDAGESAVEAGNLGGWESRDALRQSVPAIRADVRAARTYFSRLGEGQNP